MKLKSSVWGCGMRMALVALVAFGVSCSGPEETEFKNTIEGPSRAESVAFLKALQAMKFSRSDTEKLAPIRWFEDSSIEEARDTANWEGSLGSFVNGGIGTGKFGVLASGVGHGSNPQSALLKALHQYASFVMDSDLTQSGNQYGQLAVSGTSSSGDPDVSKSRTQGKLGPFDYASQETRIESHDPTGIHSTIMTLRYRYSRSGKTFSCKEQITDTHTPTDSSVHIKFTSKPAGLELADIVRGLVEDPTSRFSFVFLSDKAGEDYEVHMEVFLPKKK